MWREWPGGWLGVWLALGGLLACYYLVPLAALFLAPATRAGGIALARPAVVGAVTTSVASATVSTALSLLFGLPLGYWIARTRVRWRSVVRGLAALPLVLPPVVSGLVLLLVVGPDTPVGRLAGSVGLPLTRSFVGVVLAQTFVASPFVVVTATAAFGDVDRTLEEAARVQGASPATTFRRVTLPLAWPGVLAGATLAFARSLGEFGATLMLAYYPRTMPVQIWTGFTSRGLDAAFPAAALLTLVAVVALVALTALGRVPW